MNLAALWDQLVDAVCRPPRDDSYTEADLVGGRRASFRLFDRKFYRQDVQLTNARGQKLQASHYRPCVVTSADGRLPVVIYCHCNSGSRRDAEEILYHLLPKGITVFAMDFSGSGLSEGGYVTLGALEVDDLAAVVQYLREEGSSSTIGLWGRSMGAVTALLYSQLDPSVAGMVLDSPFSRLVDLMLELATDQQLRIPKPLIKMALAMLKRSVKKRAGFSVDKVAPLDAVGASFIPALFGHAKDDTFVYPHHSERLFQAYSGDKNFVTFPGEHNSVRPDFFYDSALIFLMQALRVEELVGPQMDLQAVPEDQLPHLHRQRGSIYVAGSHSTSEEDLAGEGAHSRPGSRSARSRSPSPGSPLSRASSSLSRQLNVPWTLPLGRSSARRGEALVGAAGDSQPQSPAVGHLAALLEASGVEERGGEGGEGAYVGRLSEEEALQRALEMSLQDARRAQQAQQAQQEHSEQQGLEPAAAVSLGEGGGAGSGQQAVGQEVPPGAAQALLPQHMRYNAAFASSGGEGRRNPLYGGTSTADVPATTEEEHAMLAAALAASMQGAQLGQKTPTDAVPAGLAAGAHGAGASKAAAHGAGASKAAEPAFTAGVAAGPAPEFGAGASEQGGASGSREEEAGKHSSQVPAGSRSLAASQASADKHACQEASAVRLPSEQLAQALGKAAALQAGTDEGCS